LEAFGRRIILPLGWKNWISSLRGRSFCAAFSLFLASLPAGFSPISCASPVSLKFIFLSPLPFYPFTLFLAQTVKILFGFLKRYFAFFALQGFSLAFLCGGILWRVRGCGSRLGSGFFLSFLRLECFGVPEDAAPPLRALA